MHKLQKLLKDFNSLGYGDDNAPYVLQENNSKKLTLVNDKFTYTDIFWGGEPYGGYEMIYEDGKEKLFITYYGWVEKLVSFEDVYEFLRSALRKGAYDKDVLHRGPCEYIEGEFTYSNMWDGDIEQFQLVEKIYKNEKLVYQARFMGGLISVK